MAAIGGWMVRLILMLLATGLLASCASPPSGWVDPLPGSVRVCPVERPGGEPVGACAAMPLHLVDTQDRLVRLEMTFMLAEHDLEGERPTGLFVHAKAASIAWINGVELGANGMPAASPGKERVGDMDAVFYVPRGVLHEGENRLVLAMSAHRGYVHLDNPVHQVLLAPYGSPVGRIGTHWFPLLTFGLFLAGFAFFGVSALRGQDRTGSALVAAASLFAALQLASESLRGLVAYPYPVHDLRLLAILVFAVLLGLSVFAYVERMLFGAWSRGQLLALAALAGICLAVAIWMEGFDSKTLLSLTAVAVAASLAGLLAMRRANRAGRTVALAGLGAAAIMVATGTSFLNLFQYLLAAALLLVLFVRQAQSIARERAAGRAAQARAEDLSRALDQAEGARSPQPLSLSSGGRTDYVDPAQVVHFAGAGDYVEVHFQGGRDMLADESLAALEEALPPGFIRVHRSHIVNAAFVEALERDPSGTGRLVLSDGSEVPVSRRIMPHVRAALSRG